MKLLNVNVLTAGTVRTLINGFFCNLHNRAIAILKFICSVRPVAEINIFAFD